MDRLTRRGRGMRWGAAALLLLVACGGPPRRRSVALDTLRRREPVTVVHVTAPGESLVDVARRYYGDPRRAAAIASLNDLSPDATPDPGTPLRIVLDPVQWQRARERGVADAAYNAGVAAMGRGDLPAAEADFREALAVDPDLGDARYNLALVLLRRGRYEAATVELERLLARRPADRDARLALASALFHQTRFAEAAERYRALLRDDPRDRDAAYGLALALDAGGDRDAAVAAWRSFLALEPRGSRATEARRRLQDLSR